MATDTQPDLWAADAPISRAALDVEQAVSELEQNLQAYQAVQQIVTADSQRAESHLPLLKRENLSALLGVLNSSLGYRWEAAKLATKNVQQALRDARLQDRRGPP